MTNPTRLSTATVSLLALLCVGCSADEAKTQLTGAASTGGTGADAGRGAGGDGGAGAATTASPFAGGGPNGPMAGSNGSGGQPPLVTGAETLCDGIDDDGNGVIDDVDVGGDGICDCLTVATLGEAGTAGDGSIFNAWLSSRSSNGATTLGDAVLTDALLAPFQVLIIQNVNGYDAYTAGEIEALQRWVEAGGGVMTLIGYAGANEANNVNGLLAPYGMSYGTADVMQAGFDLFALSNQTASVVEWRDHPISYGVSAVGMDNGKPVLGSGQIVATGEGHTLAMIAEAGMGKVFVWGDEWITFDSEWTGRDDYQIELFWVNILTHLTPATECQVPIPDILLI